MRWGHQPSRWGDVECVSALFLTFAAVVALPVLTWLPGGVPRCLLKAWTGIPCFTCGGFRALQALLAGEVAAAFRLQPLLTLLAAAAAAWCGYGVTGPLLKIPRVRVRLARREKGLLAAGAALLVPLNWTYLLVDGR